MGKGRRVFSVNITRGLCMNGFLLLVPFLLVRFGLLSFLNKEAVRCAAFFAPVIGTEVLAYWFYQLSNILIFVSLCFLNVFNFAAPCDEGLHTNGLYRFSRNPMYVAYFIFFTGCALWVQSPVFWLVVLVFIGSSHWIILSEERWCVNEFGGAYSIYMKKVRRHL